jgi:hypothetical protein
MPLSVSIGGTTYARFTTAFTNGAPAAGVYHALPDIGVPPMFDLPMHDRREQVFVGVPFSGEKDYGGNDFRKKLLYLDMVVVGTDTTYYSNLAALHAKIKNNARYTVTFGGQTFNGCKMAGPHGPPIAYYHMSGLMVGVYRIVLKQLSDQN